MPPCVLALTPGEPAGIGPDVVLMASAALAGATHAPRFVVFADAQLLRSRANRLGMRDVAITPYSSAEQAAQAALGSLGGLAVVQSSQPVADHPGVLDTGTGGATVEALERAVDAVRTGVCDAMVTAPIHKANLYATGFAFPGHTEFLEEYARRHWPDVNARAVMMMAGPELRTVPVTVHIPLADVSRTLTSARLVDVAHRTARDLRARFAIAAPRLVVAGLNPHAGEGGALGREDDAVIAPAVAQLRADGIDARGPLPADTLFHAEARATYDAALCMYHDQALIPVKALDFHNTVNVTLGLPFVRTSPDHGTALDLAGTGRAAPDSMVAAIRLAARLSAKRLSSQTAMA